MYFMGLDPLAGSGGVFRGYFPRPLATGLRGEASSCPRAINSGAGLSLKLLCSGAIHSYNTYMCIVLAFDVSTPFEPFPRPPRKKPCHPRGDIEEGW